MAGNNPYTNGSICANFLINVMGATRTAAAAVCGNFQQENSFRTSGDGIAQWIGSRRTNLRNWCSKNGYDYRTLKGQLYFFQHEVLSNARFKNAWTRINSLPDNYSSVDKATEIWCNIYEAPGKPMMGRRKIYARQWWKLSNGESTGVPIAWNDQSREEMSDIDSNQTEDQTRLEVTEVIRTQTVGTVGSHKNDLSWRPSWLQNGLELTIFNDKFYAPNVVDGVELEQSRKGSPSKLTFTVMKDPVLNIQEGNAVTVRHNGRKLFAGYIFQKTRSDNNRIKVTAYDQLRYLKSKDTYSYSNTYSGFLKMVCEDYGLEYGEIADTGYVIPSRVEECSLLDMLQTASDETVLNTGKLYVLYDDFGKIVLKNIEDMKLGVLVDDGTARGFDYLSTIDKDFYTQVKIAYDDKDSGKRMVSVSNITEAQDKYGILTFYEKLDDNSYTTVVERMSTVLSYYAAKHRELTIRDLPGNTDIRGGSSIVIRLDLGDILLNNRMLVEQAVHKFNVDEYTVDVTLSGIRGEFSSE